MEVTIIESWKWARHYIKCFIGIVSFNVILKGRYYYHAHFKDKKIEAQNNQAAAQNHNANKQGSQNLNPGLSDSVHF